MEKEEEITTIRLHNSTKKKLSDYKIYDRETFEEVIMRLIKNEKK